MQPIEFTLKPKVLYITSDFDIDVGHPGANNLAFDNDYLKCASEVYVAILKEFLKDLK